jgi:phasin
MEKAYQRADGFRPPPFRPSAQDRGQVREQESTMANDAFRPDIPEPLRELVKMSIEQAMRAFETFASTSEKTWKSLENSSQSARAGLYALNAKIAEITRRNAEANFALAMRLAEAKDVNQAVELHNQHMKRQMETFVQQLEEMRDLTARIIEEANPASPPRPSGLSSVRSSSSYAPSSSFTPGETGRTY